MMGKKIAKKAIMGGVMSEKDTMAKKIMSGARMGLAKGASSVMKKKKWRNTADGKMRY